MAEEHPRDESTAQVKAEQLQAEDVVDVCRASVSQHSAALCSPHHTVKGALSHCPIVTLLSCYAVLMGVFSQGRRCTSVKTSSLYSPNVPGRQVEKLLGNVFPAEAGSVIQAGPGPFLISLA